jgi:hypothetical protein
MVTEKLKRGANLEHSSVAYNPDSFMKTRELAAQTLRGTTPTTEPHTHIHKSGTENNALFIFTREH